MAQSTDLAAPTEATSWADALAGAPAVLQLPTDRPRPQALSGELSSAGTVLDGPTAAALRGLAAEALRDEPAADAALDVAVLAAWLVLLRRTVDEPDLVVGCGGVGGATPGGDDLVLVRGEVDLDGGLRAAVAVAARALADAAVRGPVTLAGLLRALGVEPLPGKHPVFQVALVRETADGATDRHGSAPEPPDLVLRYRPDGDGVRVRIEAPAELVDARRVERLAGHLATLVRAGTADPDAPVGLLPLLGDEERAEIESWNATEAPHDPAVPLAARFAEQAARTPDAVAVELGETRLSYAELDARADALARTLQSRGVGPDVPVAVLAERSVEMVVGVLAVLKAGGAYVPVDPAYPAARREYMVTDSGARVVLTQAALADAARATAGAGADGADVVLLDDPSSYAEGGPLETRATGEHLGYVIYTSGSTGKPKGVALSQSALGNLVAWQLRRPQAVPGRRTLQFSSLSFDVSFQEIFTTWCSGGTLVLVADATRRDPLSLLDVLVSARVERLFLPYVALRGLAAASEATGRVPQHLREVYTAGEQLQVDPLLRKLFAALPDCVLENQYGPSESHVVTASTLTGTPDTWPLLPSIGGPIANSEALVLDARRRPRPVGVPGELYLGGTCLARGYLGKPELTAERFLANDSGLGRSDRLYKTGDLARWLPDGTLEFLGRTDHQVKFRGYRIEPGEVGATLSGCPGVSQCVATVREHEVGGARLTAYLIPERGEHLDLAAVHAFAREALPAYMVPSHYLVVDSFPLTPSGKVDTQALPDAVFDRGILSSDYEAPRSPDELALARIWRSLLGVPDVGVHDDFFELGGDSLMAAEMLEMIAAELGRELPLGALAQSPTIAALAAVLRGDEETAVWRSLVPLKTGGARTPLFLVHGGSGNVATFPMLARQLPDDQPVYALQWDGLDGSRGLRTIEAMADHYLAEIRSVQPSGPYLLAGQCVGGLIARVITRRLLADGERVDLLVMYDSPHLASPGYVPGKKPSPLDYVFVANGRKNNAKVLLHRARRRRIPPGLRVHAGGMVMRSAVFAHTPVDLPPTVPTHYFASGESDARAIALTGRWTDGAMGWAAAAGDAEGLTVHRVEGGHNQILYAPEAVAILTELLEQAQREPAEA